jgi:hypothetical protein
MIVAYPIWEFRKMNKGEMNVDPIKGEIFSAEALGLGFLLKDFLLRTRL